MANEQDKAQWEEFISTLENMDFSHATDSIPESATAVHDALARVHVASNALADAINAELKENGLDESVFYSEPGIGM